MTKERQVSQVILDLEKKIDDILGYVKSIDTNVKLVLNSVNLNNRALPSKIGSKIATVEPVEFAQVSGDSKAPRTVQGKLIYSDSKVMILAQVEIFDSSGQLVKKTKTNNAGKWIASLLPGTYNVRVAKAGNSVKPSVAGQYAVTVQPGNEPLQLESKKI